MACVSINDCDVKSHVVRFDEACLNILCLSFGVTLLQNARLLIPRHIQRPGN
jgi:hypothetical protein